MLDYLLNKSVFTKKRSPLEWAQRGRCIYYRRPNIFLRNTRLALAAIAVWTGANTYFALTQKLLVEVPVEDAEESSQPNETPKYRYEYQPAALNRRIPQAIGTVLLGVGLSGVVIVLGARTAKRLHLLVPLKGSSEIPKIMIENVMHARGAGRVFDINRCTFNGGKNTSDFYLRVDGIKGQWACYTDKALIPNVTIGPNLPSEETRVASELYKVLWDYRTKRDGLIIPGGKKSAEGMFHDFPWEPTVPASEGTFFKQAREASKPAKEIEVAHTYQTPDPGVKEALITESMFEGPSERPEAQITKTKAKKSKSKKVPKEDLLSKSTAKLEKAIKRKLAR